MIRIFADILSIVLIFIWHDIPFIQTFDIKNLEKSIPLLENESIEQYADFSWCQGIRYRGHTYVKRNNYPSKNTCMTGIEETMTSESWYLFHKVKRAISGYLSSVSYISVKGSENHFKQASWEISFLGLFVTKTLIWEPGYRLPENIGNEVSYIPINKDWYKKIEDWN